MTEHVRNEGVYTIEYLLLQIAKIQDQTDYLTSAIEKLSEMGESCGPFPNIQGQAKAQAMGEIVSSRERTNQQILSLYEKMYEDLKPASGSNPEVLE